MATAAEKKEFFTNVIMLGQLAYDNYIAEVNRGERVMDFAELNEMKAHMETCKAELRRVE